MVRAIVRTALIGCAFLFSSCMKYPEQLILKDTLGIGTSLSDILKEKYGLFVNIHSKISSTDDFFHHTLLLLGDIEGHTDMRIVTLSFEKAHNFLFKEVIFIDAISDERCQAIDTPCATRTDTLESIDYKKLPRVWNTYGPAADLNKIFERNLDSTECVFLMMKSNSKHFSNRLKELIIK
ncbi:MAG: hypothetical protein JXB42_00035 [Deltaproteobacteria bacterium]|nr:hypothetical protein [Deltaproteobacteria bacterium]